MRPFCTNNIEITVCNLRHQLLGFCVGLVALVAQPISAHAANVYFAGYLGLSQYGDQEFSEGSVPRSGDMEFKNGMSFAGALGLRVSRYMRVEAELGYNKTDLDRIDFANAGSFELGGEISGLTTMINLYYDFDVTWPLKPYVGAGIGYGWYDADIDDVSGLAVDVSDSASGLTWQVGGGMRYQLGSLVALDGGYRYVDSSDLGFGSYDIDYGAHEFRLGLSYDLGPE